MGERRRAHPDDPGWRRAAVLHVPRPPGPPAPPRPPGSVRRACRVGVGAGRRRAVLRLHGGCRRAVAGRGGDLDPGVGPCPRRARTRGRSHGRHRRDHPRAPWRGLDHPTPRRRVEPGCSSPPPRWTGQQRSRRRTPASTSRRRSSTGSSGRPGHRPHRSVGRSNWRAPNAAVLPTNRRRSRGPTWQPRPGPTRTCSRTCSGARPRHCSPAARGSSGHASSRSSAAPASSAAGLGAAPLVAELADLARRARIELDVSASRHR